MKVSDIFISIMKIMWRDFEKIRSSCFGDIQGSAKSLNSEWSCTYIYYTVVRKRVFKIARTKVHQNFLASKYDIKRNSDATLE